MSLSQLLVVNESLKHKPGGPNPFAMTKDRLVPEFPVRRGASVRLSSSASAVPETEQAEPSGGRQPSPVAGKAGLPVEPVLPGRWSSLAENRNRRRSASRAVALPDCVRVERNDLSETDFEVLPVKPPPAPRQRPLPVAGRAAGMWNRFTARLMSLSLGWFKT